MKKALSILVAIVLIIIIVLVVKNNINKSQIEYEVSKVEKFLYVKYKDGNKYGVMDREGNILTEAKYVKIEIPNPEKDIFVCYESEEKGIVLNSKKEVLFEGYDNIQAIKLKNIASLLCYEKNALKYEKDGLYGLIDFNGKVIVKNEYKSIENLQGVEGKFVVSKDGKQGVVNYNGRMLVEPKYDRIASDGYYNNDTKYIKSGFIVSNTTENGYRYGYINYSGEKTLDVEYNDIIRIIDKEDIYLIASKNGQYGLYQGGKEVIKPEYQSISYADNGAIIVEKNKQYGVANINGEIKSGIKYDDIEENGIYLYAQNARENNVYDANGNKVEINFNKTIYETNNEQYKITTLVNNDVLYYGIEDKDGKTLVDAGYKYIEYMYKNYFLAEDEKGKYGVISASGKKEIDFKYDLVQKLKDKNIIQASSTNSKTVDFFSNDLKKILSMNSAKVDNKNNYIRVYNDDKQEFFDIDGNKIEENSGIIQNEKQTELPNKIGDYKKNQYALDDAYYTK